MAASTGCTFPETQIAPGEKHLLVHAVLDLGNRDQKVRVNYTDGANSVGQVGAPQVSITTPEGVQMFAIPDSQSFIFDTTRVPNGGYRISLDAYGVTLVPGGTYTLHVHTPAGDDATGTTTIPLASPVTVPTAAEQFDRLHDTLRLNWPNVAGAESYEVQVWRAFDSTRNRFEQGPIRDYDAFTTHALALGGTVLQLLERSPVFVGQTQSVVLVSAVDINYYEYYRLLSDPLGAAAPSHLTGALGVFGSVVPIIARRLDVQ